MRNIPAEPSLGGEGGQDLLQVLRLRFLCSPWRARSAEMSLQEPGIGNARGAGTAWEAREGAGSWQNLRTQKPTLEQGLAGLVTPWGTRSGSACS